MSQSQSSFLSHPNPALQESLALLQQKTLIVEKYAEKVSVLQNKIQELVIEIQRLNWENREKDYHDEYLRRVNLKQLLKQGFGQQIIMEHQNSAKPQNSISWEQKVILQGRRKVLMKILVDLDAQEIILTQKMELVKDNQQNQSSKSVNAHQKGNQQSCPADGIEQYCKQVLKQVEQMKQRLQKQDASNKQRATKLQQENKLLVVKISKLQILLEEGKTVYEGEKAIKLKQIQDLKRLKELRERDYNQLAKQIQQIKLQHKDQLKKLQDQIAQLNKNLKINQEKYLKSSHQFQKISQQFEKSKKELGQSIKQLEQCKKQLSLERQSHSKTSKQLNAQKQAHSKASKQLIGEKQGHSKTKSTMEQLKIQLPSKQSLLTQLNQSLAEQQLKVTQKQATLTKLQTQLLQLQKQLKDQHQKYEEQQKIHQEQLNNLEEINTNANLSNEYQSKITLLTKEKSHLTQQLTLLQQSTTAINQQNNTLTQQLQALTQQLTQLNQQHNSLKSQALSHQQKSHSLTQQLQKLTSSLAQSSKQLTSKNTLIQHLQTKLSQLSQQLFTQQQEAAHLRNMYSSHEPTITIIHNSESTFSQTDPELILDAQFLRQTKQKATPQNIQVHKICLPPSLDILPFDFDNSMSSSAQNVSNLSINYGNSKQLYSNLSSSSFSKNDKHLEEMHTTNIVKVHQEKKSSSEQKIQVPTTNIEQGEKPHSNQNIKTDYLNTKEQDPIVMSQLKELKPKAKVASYSQKNIIVEEPNEDEEHNEFKKKSKKNILLQVNPSILKPTKSEGSQGLIESREIMTSSDSQRVYQNTHQDFYDPVNDVMLEHFDSDNPSETYKNQLARPQNHPSQLSKGAENRQGKTKSPKDKEKSFKPSELLDLKSPENIMKSLIEKSFPIQKNPFKLTNEYINIHEVLKQEEIKTTSKDNQNKGFEQSNELLNSDFNILILSKEEIDEKKQDQIKASNSQKYRTLFNTPGTQNESKAQTKNKIQSNQKQTQFVTPEKELIEATESVNLASLRQIQKENNLTSKSKKKPKVIYLRR